jgi:hypothetical protein
MFLSFIKGYLLMNFHKASQHETIVKDVKKFEKNFSFWKNEITPSIIYAAFGGKLLSLHKN